MKSSGLSFFEFTLQKSREHQQNFQTRSLSVQQLDQFQAISAKSFVDQKKLEDSDRLSFKEYLNRLMQGYADLSSGT
jgi:hypothetical protein